MKKKILDVLPRNTAIVLIIFAILAYFFPDGFSWVKGMRQSIILGFIIFCMGMSLEDKDIQKVIMNPKLVLIGVIAQYTIMPLSAYVLCRVFKPSLGIEIGLILVACCPGAAASNLMTYLANADVGYSIGITLCTTLLAPIVSPLLSLVCLKSVITVPAVDMIKSILIIILIPLTLGFIVKRLLRNTRSLFVLQKITPSLSVLGLGFIVAGPIAIYQLGLEGIGITGIVLAILLNIMGYYGGWNVGKLFGLDKEKKVALSIEIGMQNAGLAIGLATTFFLEYKQAAYIAAFACAMYAIIGSFVTIIFRKKLD